MAGELNGEIAALVTKNEQTILPEWMELQKKAGTLHTGRISEGELLSQSKNFLHLLRDALAKGGVDVANAAYEPAKAMLTDLSRSRALQGFSPTETATFVFSLKQPLFNALNRDKTLSAEQIAATLWSLTVLLDQLGLLTLEVFQKSREEVIVRQQREIAELSTPVVKLWDGILALPLIGTLDSQRTQVVMENLLQTIVDVEAEIAIIDITGVPTVDTLTAQHLLKTVAAARLMGADCLIRHSPADRADHGASRRRAERHFESQFGRRLRGCAASDRARRHEGKRNGETDRFGAQDRRARCVTMDRIPILKFGNALLVTIQVDMHDRLATALEEDLTGKIVSHNARGVLIDISALEIVDSFIGRMLDNIAAVSRILDADTVVVGMRPAVAITLVELGLSLTGVKTALNVERGMALIQDRLAESEADDADDED